MMPYTPPSYKSEGFNCPLCNFYSHQIWSMMFYGKSIAQFAPKYAIDKMELSLCLKCNQYLVWYDGKIVFPIVNSAPPPHVDMTKEVKEIYEEAKTILCQSPRAASALLRTAIATLVDEVLGKNKETLNHNIGRLVTEKKLSVEIQRSLDVLRVVGDHALHPSVIEMEDIDENDNNHAISLFELINLIVDELISRPKKIKQYYDRLPQRQLEQIQKRDNMNLEESLK
jgi:hypothetical protein